MKVTFKNWVCMAVGSYYMSNDARSIDLRDLEDKSPVARATVNLVNESLENDEVFIKDYSENEGMVEALVAANIIYPESLGTAISGHVNISKYRLTDEALEKLWERKNN